MCVHISHEITNINIYKSEEKNKYNVNGKRTNENGI